MRIRKAIADAARPEDAPAVFFASIVAQTGQGNMQPVTLSDDNNNLASYPLITNKLSLTKINYLKQTYELITGFLPGRTYRVQWNVEYGALANMLQIGPWIRPKKASDGTYDPGDYKPVNDGWTKFSRQTSPTSDVIFTVPAKGPVEQPGEVFVPPEPLGVEMAFLVQCYDPNANKNCDSNYYWSIKGGSIMVQEMPLNFQHPKNLVMRPNMMGAYGTQIFNCRDLYESPYYSGDSSIEVPTRDASLAVSLAKEVCEKCGNCNFMTLRKTSGAMKWTIKLYNKFDYEVTDPQNIRRYTYLWLPGPDQPKVTWPALRPGLTSTAGSKVYPIKGDGQQIHYDPYCASNGDADGEGSCSYAEFDDDDEGAISSCQQICEAFPGCSGFRLRYNQYFNGNLDTKKKRCHFVNVATGFATTPTNATETFFYSPALAPAAAREAASGSAGPAGSARPRLDLIALPGRRAAARAALGFDRVAGAGGVFQDSPKGLVEAGGGLHFDPATGAIGGLRRGFVYELAAECDTPSAFVDESRAELQGARTATGALLFAPDRDEQRVFFAALEPAEGMSGYRVSAREVSRAPQREEPPVVERAAADDKSAGLPLWAVLAIVVTVLALVLFLFVAK